VEEDPSLAAGAGPDAVLYRAARDGELAVLRADPPGAVPANRGALAEARRMADQVRQALELPPRTPDAPLPREALLAATVAASPELAFVRRAKRREALGNGTLWGYSWMPSASPVEYVPAGILIQAPGAFLVLGLLLGAYNLLSRRRSES